MKKIIIHLFAIVVCIQLNFRANAQVTIASNFSNTAASQSVGWLGGTQIKPLDINNTHAGQPIRFFTGGVALANQRMTILGTGANAGFVGIGTNPVRAKLTGWLA